MRTTRIIALIAGSIGALLAVAVLVSGAALGAAHLAQRGDDDYLDVSLDRLSSDSPAITAESIDLRTEPGTPRWVIDALDTDVRVRVTAADAGESIFVGIAPEEDLDQFLAGIAHDEIQQVDDHEAVYRSREGSAEVAPPTQQEFWEVSSAGVGTQELKWEARSGQWAVAVMNADGSPGVAADVTVGIRSAAFLPASLTLLAVGVAGLVLAGLVLVFGGRGLTSEPIAAPHRGGAVTAPTASVSAYPLTLEGRLDPALSRWMWLVKWVLAIPHLIVLFFLWIAFLGATIAAGISILFTGRYPRGLFEFNVGVLRWSWRVAFYAFSGGLGTDRYPPFTLDRAPDYPATLDVVHPERLSRLQVLVKWWLFALPHYLVVAVIAGGGFGWETGSGVSMGWGPTGGGLVGLFTIVAGVILLVTASYPRPLFDLIVGLNRWVYRVIAYAALMTDRYPPFRLDQGEAEPGTSPTPSGPSVPEGSAIALDDDTADRRSVKSH